MSQTSTTIFLLLSLMFASSGLAQSADVVEELKTCARMTDNDARFACFDTLGNRMLSEESADDEPAQEEEAAAIEPTQQEAAVTSAPTPKPATQPETVPAAAVASAKPLPDDAGLPKFGDEHQPANVLYSGTVTSCEQGRNRIWYFVFANGQVWKEVNKSGRHYKDCSFDVTITKDFFGYRMQTDEFARPVRVKRHQ